LEIRPFRCGAGARSNGSVAAVEAPIALPRIDLNLPLATPAPWHHSCGVFYGEIRKAEPHPHRGARKHLVAPSKQEQLMNTLTHDPLADLLRRVLFGTLVLIALIALGIGLARAGENARFTGATQFVGDGS